MAKTTYSREELERQLSESRREFWAADVTINNLELKLADMAAQLANAENKCRELEAKISAMSEDQQKAIESIKQADAAVKLAHEKFSAMAAENAALKESEREFDKMCAEEFGPDWVSELTETPATDAFLAEVRAQGLALFAASLKVAGICEHPYLDAAIDLAAKLRQDANSARLQRDEPVTDSTNQQFESLSRGAK